MLLDLLLYLLEYELDRLGVLVRRGLFDDFAAIPATPHRLVFLIVDLGLEVEAAVRHDVVIFSDVYLCGDDGDGDTLARLRVVEGLEPVLGSS